MQLTNPSHINIFGTSVGSGHRQMVGISGGWPAVRLLTKATTLRILFVLVAFGSYDRNLAAGNEEDPNSIVVHSVGMTVADMERSLEFYTEVLSFEKISDVEILGSEIEKLQGIFGLRMRVATLRLGAERLELTEYLTPRGRPMPPDSQGNDQWFQHVAIIVSDMDRAYQRLRDNKVAHVSTGPQTLPAWNRSAAGIRAFYFKDPDGHFLEILQFPSDKGDARWRLATDRLFLGIDHTAIVVRDTEASLSFYRDLLGLKVAGESENYGEEQEHLNHVFGARLRITTLRASEGPGVELLEYLAPQTGRNFQSDTRANDVSHWQIQFHVRHLNQLEPMLIKRHANVSSGIVNMQNERSTIQQGFLARDPDGHGLLFAIPSKE